ncbi:MAG: hypothetical protein ABIJ39_12230 [Chloroflexota bacterium]
MSSAIGTTELLIIVCLCIPVILAVVAGIVFLLVRRGKGPPGSDSTNPR